MAKRRCVDDIWIFWMDDHPSDVMRVRKTHVLPRLAGVSGFVDSVAPRRTLAVIRFTAADPDYGWIGRRDRNVSDGGHPLLVKNRLPGSAVVRRFPPTAAGNAHLPDVRIAF